LIHVLTDGWVKSDQSYFEQIRILMKKSEEKSMRAK